MNRIPFRFRFSWIKLSQFPYDPDSGALSLFPSFVPLFGTFFICPRRKVHGGAARGPPPDASESLESGEQRSTNLSTDCACDSSRSGKLAWAGCEPLFVAHNAQPPSQSVIPVEFLRKTGLLDESGIRQVDKLRVTAELPAFRGVLVHSTELRYQVPYASIREVVQKTLTAGEELAGGSVARDVGFRLRREARELNKLAWLTFRHNHVGVDEDLFRTTVYLQELEWMAARNAPTHNHLLYYWASELLSSRALDRAEESQVEEWLLTEGNALSEGSQKRPYRQSSFSAGRPNAANFNVLAAPSNALLLLSAHNRLHQPVNRVALRLGVHVDPQLAGGL